MNHWEQKDSVTSGASSNMPTMDMMDSKATLSESGEKLASTPEKISDMGEMKNEQNLKIAKELQSESRVFYGYMHLISFFWYFMRLQHKCLRAVFIHP